MDRFVGSKRIDIEPFWNRIPALFLYGLQPTSLALATASGLLLYLFPNFWFSLILYAVVMKYSMEALQYTMRGERSPPPFNRSVLLDKYEIPLTLFAILALYALALLSMSQSLGWTAALALYLFGLFLFPAMIMCLGMSESFSFSANPIHWLALVKRIGWPYLALYGLLISFGGAQASIEYFALEHLNQQNLVPVWMSVNTLFMIISFHTMGYVIMQYHQELDEPAPVHAMQDEDDASSPLLEKFVEEGNTQAAIQELISLIDSDSDNIVLRKKLHNYAMLNQQHQVMERFDPDYMRLLLKQNDHTSAAQLFSDCRSCQTNCHPRRADAYLPLFENLRSQHKFKDAVSLAKGFHKRFPGNEHTPALYLALAQVFCEELQRDDLAKQLLLYLQNNFQQHEKLPDVHRYIKLLDNLSTAP